MNILTLDLATRTGWAYGPGSQRLTKPQAFGAVDLNGASTPAKWANLLDWLGAQFQVMRPDLVVFEAPLPPAAQKHANTARFLWGLCAATEIICYRWSIKCQEQDASTVRKRLIGHGRPSKEDIVSWCRARGLVIDDHNAADAVTLWYFAAALRS